ncbi:hypothetical protein [Arthrobacter sp. B6]|uniref:hypothetical protein n=1 Tax=Arthrobacter sp. B6 TaxID=1570137 RepID=UPI00082FF8C0|nr:hypothetical protein [Arthrobacter sp. B6]
MTSTKYTRFVADCITVQRPNDSGLTEDEMYGVYVSWCFLSRLAPGSPGVFWAAMAQEGLGQRRLDAGRYVRPGLGMTGPAAVDYILSSQPSLV